MTAELSALVLAAIVVGISASVVVRNGKALTIYLRYRHLYLALITVREMLAKGDAEGAEKLLARVIDEHDVPKMGES